MSITSAEWFDLLDPDEETLRRTWPADLHPQAVEAMLEAAGHDHEPRPKLESHGDYVFGVLLVPVLVPHEDRVFYQECDVALAEGVVLTVRKTPEQGEPLNFDDVRAACVKAPAAGQVAYLIVDEVAEGFLDLVDALNDEVDELEDHVEEWDNDLVRRRLSDLRHDVVHIRQTLGPTRDAVRRVIDDRVDLDDRELFPREIEVHFGDSYDKLLRATEGLESARDLIAGVRDYHTAKVANDQNEVMKFLTVIAAVFLPPTFIVGLYGQNFDTLPELHWANGYGFSWLLVIATTVVQVWYFRRKRWI